MEVYIGMDVHCKKTVYVIQEGSNVSLPPKATARPGTPGRKCEIILTLGKGSVPLSC